MNRFLGSLSVVAVAAALSSCGEGPISSSTVPTLTAGGQTHLAAVTTTAAAVFPVVVPFDQAISDAAVQALKASDQLDAACATTPMSASLAALRPNGTGCPRPAPVVSQ